MKTVTLTEFEQAWICKAAHAAIRSLNAVDDSRKLRGRAPLYDSRRAKLREIINKVK